jgi:glycosyltransferase involved in cell wall biosynthesis
VRIGIDISQTAYSGTGVSNYLTELVNHLLEIDKENEYVLFFSSLRKTIQNSEFTVQNSRVSIKTFKFPPILLDLLWNRLHIMPIEWLIGPVDIFISSDWTQPPTEHAKSATILYDLIVYKHPKETAKKIVDTQKRRLRWVKKECDMVFCISKSTKQDAMEVLRIEEKKLTVIYPGI